MPTVDLHEKAFSEETITKLSIFQSYAKAWIPTFVMSKFYWEMNIFDFFAGPGYDISGVEGSPIRLLKEILGQIGNIFSHKTRIHVYFNELDSNKFIKLQSACTKFIELNKELKRCVESGLINIIYTNKPCEQIFDDCYKKMQKYPSLVYLDQNGVKFLQDNFFLKLVNCKQVDFLYFISSSYFARFGNKDEFKNILDIDWENAHKNPYKYIHQHILSKLRDKIPNRSKTKLYPFTIKKGTNIYGIIFGASHPFAVDKFLHITWKANEINGYANFDIDDDNLKSMKPNLFGEIEFTKIRSFQEDVKQQILSEALKTNEDVYLYSLREGHIPKHAEEVVKKMKRDKLIFYKEKSPLITYNQVYQNERIISYEIIKK